MSCVPCLECNMNQHLVTPQNTQGIMGRRRQMQLLACGGMWTDACIQLLFVHVFFTDLNTGEEKLQ